jgi:hypothetical protein
VKSKETEFSKNLLTRNFDPVFPKRIFLGTEPQHVATCFR